MSVAERLRSIKRVGECSANGVCNYQLNNSKNDEINLFQEAENSTSMSAASSINTASIFESHEMSLDHSNNDEFIDGIIIRIIYLFISSS